MLGAQLKRLVLIGFLYMFSFVIAAQENILIYAGPGAGAASLENTLATVKLLVGDRYNVMTVGPEILKAPAWLDNTALLIMPGGADRPYLAKLKGQGNANIRHYVENGGKFLGICAGAYYAADRIEFDKGGELEVTGIRELKFFPGLVSGPTYEGYDYRDLKLYNGTRAAQLYWQQAEPFSKQHELHVFYNGGGSFIDADKFSNVTILAKYNPEKSGDQTQPAAIIECSVGKGTAILSGPHFEWDPVSLDESFMQLKAIKPKLLATNDERLILAKHLLYRLGIS